MIHTGPLQDPALFSPFSPSVSSVCSVVRSPGERPYPVGQSSKGPIKRSAIPGPLPSFSAHIFAICGPSAGCRRVVSLPAFSV